MQSILGFTGSTIKNLTANRVSVGSSRQPSIDGDRNVVYVYCDVVENVPVGDTVAPLLRIVNANGPFGTIINRTFERPRYIPIQKKNFGSLEIDIRDGFGRPIPFEFGTVIATLHFRRSTSPYLLA